MHVAEIWQYPVKSMVGATVPAAEVTPVGLAGDRTWAARDLERGGIRGAKHIGGLMQLAATYTGRPGGPVTIALPDGGTTSTEDPDVDARVSAAVGRRIRLEPLPSADDREHFRRGAPYHDDLMDELNAVFGREGGEPLPDLSAFPPEIFEFESPPGTYHDAYPLMVMTTSALRAMQAALPDSAIDTRRFRPSLVVDTGDEAGHPEQTWIGHRLRVGAVELDVVGGCPRCGGSP